LWHLQNLIGVKRSGSFSPDNYPVRAGAAELYVIRRKKTLALRYSRQALLSYPPMTVADQSKPTKISLSAAIVVLIMVLLSARTKPQPAWADAATPIPGTAVVVPSGGGSTSPLSQELKSLVASGKLSDLIYPNFGKDQAAIASFYEEGGYETVWFVGGKLTPQAFDLIKRFERADSKGLNPNDYDGPRWASRVNTLQAAWSASGPAPANATDLAARFDLAMTIATMRYIGNLHCGRENPARVEFAFGQSGNQIDLEQFIRQQVIDAQNMDDVMSEVEPPFMGYKRAEAALADYLDLASEGDGPPLPQPAKSIRPGDDYPDLKTLATRLRQLGDWPDDAQLPSAGGKYDGPAVTATKHFQRRHGLASDGVLGKSTIAAINVPLSQRVMQLELTLERYRWIPPSFEQPPIVVNIPEFRLRTMRTQSGWFLSMGVVVGKAYRDQTPVFTGEMKYVVFRPYWDVPYSIQINELVPKISRDPDYLEKNNYEVIDANKQVITDGPVSNDVLAQLRTGELFIRQKPGPKNALGLVKFIFPNSYNVYLHSTPEQSLFGRARRDFSHGCIRVADPVALAAWVLRDTPGWDEDKIKAAMNDDQTIVVNLDHPIPVLILYSTAVVEPDGEVHFFNDIYGYDKKLEDALAAGFPYQAALQVNQNIGNGD
jgi:L,D-transpeptidase YcbB